MASSGEEIQFYGFPYQDTQQFNLVCVTSLDGEQILLGKKTRGFGKDKFVLPGGKCIFWITQGGQVARRSPSYDAHLELKQETGIDVPHTMLNHLGWLMIEQFDEEEPRSIDVFTTRAHPKYTPLTPSDEFASLSWYPVDTLPYDAMPADYPLWLPHAIRSEPFMATLAETADGRFTGKVFAAQEPSRRFVGTTY